MRRTREPWPLSECASARQHMEIVLDVDSRREGRSKEEHEPGGQKVEGKLRHTTQLLCIALPMQSICKCCLTGQFTLAPSQCFRLT